MNDQRPADGEGSGSKAAFWTTIPGILTGLAAVITALVGLFTLLGVGGDGEGDSGAGVEVVEPGAAPSPAAPVAEPSEQRNSEVTAGPSPSTAPDVVDGELTMRSPDDADLEQQRVGMGVPGGDLYLYCSANQCRLSAMAGGGFITTVDGPVDRADCIDALEARQDGVLESPDLTAGKWFCMQTEQARIALVEIRSAPGLGSADLVLSYTLWY